MDSKSIMAALGVDANKANGNVSRGSTASATFADMWGPGHDYAIVWAGKSTDEYGRSVERVTNMAGQGIREWYVADCTGNGTHAAHRIRFGANGEFSKHGKRHYADMATLDGTPLSAIHSLVHAAEPKATFNQAPTLAQTCASRKPKAQTTRPTRTARTERPVIEVTATASPLALDAPAS